jgi:hypothetical protein
MVIIVFDEKQMHAPQVRMKLPVSVLIGLTKENAGSIKKTEVRMQNEDVYTFSSSEPDQLLR